MSKEDNKEEKRRSQIEIADPEEKDTTARTDQEPENQAPNQTEPEDVVEEELPPPTPEELKELRQQAAKAEEFYDRLQRQVAESDNLRKRLAKEKQDAIRYANEALI
ncbi:MAG TPA: hypothetical protein QGG93_07530 [Verrucomicrobiota bacterium]|nr:hypothetical protein [Verrucomicrobiota bacterium]